MTDAATLLPPQRTCTGCDQTDDHPMAVFGVPEGDVPVRYHFDCLTDERQELLLGGIGKAADRARIEKVIAHARADDVEHLHGHDLRLRAVELDPNQPAAVKRALGVKTTTAKG